MSAFVHRNDLKIYFSKFGEVVDVYIPKDKTTGAQKRFAFVTFNEIRMARAALASFEGHVLNDGSVLQVMPAEPRPLCVADQGVYAQRAETGVFAPVVAGELNLTETDAFAPSADGTESLTELLAVALSLLTDSF
jgi:RNA recognition motif-containing protein